MLSQPIAVLGGGNVGHTIAADVSAAGYRVNFYDHPQFADTYQSTRGVMEPSAFKVTLERGTIEIEDPNKDRREVARIHKVTTDMREAIGDAKLIIMALPSYGQELFFNTMIPFLKDDQAVFLMTGNYGSLRLRKLLSEKAPDCKATIYETNTMPYATRIVGPGKVSAHKGFGPWLGKPDMPEFYLKAKRYFVCALPAKDTNVALEEFQELYPLYSPVKNVLISALNNANTTAHPINAVLNAGRIEYAHLFLKVEFRAHREGHTPSVRRVEGALMDEINTMVEALGVKGEIDKTSHEALFEYYQTHYTPVGPLTLKSRFITEDVPYGLVPLSQLGEKFGVATPVANAIIEIASVINEEDYRKTGRTLDTLGLELTKEQIVRFVEGA